MECNAGTVGNAAGKVLRSQGGSSRHDMAGQSRTARRGRGRQAGKAMKGRISSGR